MKKIQQKTETNPRFVLHQAISKALAIPGLLATSRKNPSQNMAFKLSFELVDAAKGSGDAISKKEKTHKKAESNRTLAHFR
ncbi:hypothetical protein CDL12_27936 [Handroanthus impetiginosus]|uniref:Small ribosomal subunit protein uS7 domain-containing protein n=1 Tax=Handroanthus impetiginosus TaxID=429701 RepID=A0A2G9G2Z6_9LAMI|nr:hypothetical protein CDL12_27936 [Handroanthus impetiginosus]